MASDSLQAKLGGPIDGSTEEHDAVQHPVDDCEPAADVAGQVADNFPAEVPEKAGEAVDAYFGECASTAISVRRRGNLAPRGKLRTRGGDGGAGVARCALAARGLEFS